MHLSTAILILIASFSCFTSENCIRCQTRIVGGKPAVLGMFPYQAYLHMLVSTHVYDYNISDYRNVSGSCGGSLISEKFVLTAAHCLKSPKVLFFTQTGVLNQSRTETINVKEVDIYLGVVDLQNLTCHSQSFLRLNQSNYIVHPNFRYVFEEVNPVVNDIALIRLPEPARIDDFYIRIVQLPVTNLDNLTQIIARTSGFGDYDFDEKQPHKKQRSHLLRYLNVNIATNSQCGIEHIPTQMCSIATLMNVCAGIYKRDSGGPLVIKCNGIDILVGINSYSYIFCTPIQRSFYTRVTSYLDWIQQNINPKHEI